MARRSTLDIVKLVKAMLPQVKAGLPGGLEITPLFDQSIFVSESINEVVREAAHRGWPYSAHDPALPRLMALDVDRLHLNPIVNCKLLSSSFMHFNKPSMS